MDLVMSFGALFW